MYISILEGVTKLNSEFVCKDQTVVIFYNSEKLALC